jgi:Fe-S cluster assembly scaffold protein SufB
MTRRTLPISLCAKGISAGNSRNCYRGLVQVGPTATGARNYSQCDSMLIGDTAGRVWQITPASSYSAL